MLEVTKDLKVKNLNFRKGDNIYFYYLGLHFNSKVWQRPREFLPERFDPNNSLYFTPDGKKRNPFCFSGFGGGSRICLGKT